MSKFKVGDIGVYKGNKSLCENIELGSLLQIKELFKDRPRARVEVLREYRTYIVRLEDVSPPTEIIKLLYS